MARGVPARLTAAEGRKFGLLVGGAFLAIGALLWWRTHIEMAWVAGVLGVALVPAGLTAPTRLGPVYRGWMSLALASSKVTTPLFMGLIYFIVLAPTGMIARMLGHRPISRSRETASYWHSRPAGARRGEMNHQF